MSNQVSLCACKCHIPTTEVYRDTEECSYWSRSFLQSKSNLWTDLPGKFTIGRALAAPGVIKFWT